jgi:hypothetical protein
MTCLDRWQHVPRICLALLSLFACFVAAEAHGLVLAHEGKTDYHIYIGASAAPAERHAAEELAAFLKQATGATFPLVDKREQATGPLLVVGVNDLTKETLGARPKSGLLGDDGFEIRTHGDKLFIFGGSPRGSLYGVYFFLEKYLGCRWYSSDFSVIPAVRSVRLGKIHERQVPRFSYREVFSRDADDPLFSARNRLNGQFGHRLDRFLKDEHGGAVSIRGINIFKLVDPAKYRKGHPEYFGGGQLRFGNSKVRAIAIDTTRERLARLPIEPFYLLISHADVNSYYYGEEDKRIIDEGASPGAAFMDFVRVIAEAIAKDYPQVTVLAEAYQWSRKPPRRMVFPKNIGVMVSDIELDFSAPMNADRNQGFLQDLDDWSRLTSQILVWDYITNFAGYLQPHPNLYVLGPNLILLAQRPRVQGVFEQGSYGTRGGEFAELRTWVLAHLLWDPDRDDRALIREFIHGYYGPAAPYIEHYVEILHASAKQHPTYLAVKTPPFAAYLTAGMLGKADDLFQKAEQTVKDSPQYLRHVQMARLAVDYALLINPRLRNENGARLARFKSYLQLGGVTAYREGGKEASTDTLIQALEIPQTVAKPPAECNGRGQDDCIEIQDLGFNLAGDARLAADGMASNGAAVRMGGGSTVWGIQLPLGYWPPPEGNWRILVSVRIDPGKGAGTDLALRMGVYPGVRREVLVAEAATAYKLFELPGTWRQDKTRAIWVAPPGSGAIEALYVDRVVAVRQ